MQTLHGLLADFGQPPQLRDPLTAEPGAPTLLAPRWVVVPLLLLAFVPRAGMAWRTNVLCPDATTYVQTAKALDRGEEPLTAEGARLNTLTLALVGLHRLGFDWELGGKLWCVTLASLAVLPLYGWARRQFDDRTALLSGVLYAVHPGLVERSGELIREPGFWFFFALALYLIWRAAAEARMTWYTLAALAVGLAAFSRFEGVLLLLPLVCWSAIRFWTTPAARARVALSLALLLIVAPLAGLGAVTTLFPDKVSAALVRADLLHRVTLWWNASATAAAASHSGWQLIGQYILTVGRGFDPVFAVLLPVSVYAWRNLWLRRDMLPLFAVSALVLFASWIHLSYAHEMSSRYALTVFVTLCPLCALGLCWPRERRVSLASSARFGSPVAQGAVTLAAVLMFSAVGLVDALGSNFRSREEQAELGRWLARQYGGDLRIASLSREAAVVTYYSHAAIAPIATWLPPPEMLAKVNESKPDVVILDIAHAALEPELLTQPGLDLHRVPATAMPRGARRLILLMKGRQHAARATDRMAGILSRAY